MRPSAYFRVLAPLLLPPCVARPGEYLSVNPAYTLVVSAGHVVGEAPPCDHDTIRCLCRAGVLAPLSAQDVRLLAG
jgi:hypothetical protein